MRPAKPKGDGRACSNANGTAKMCADRVCSLCPEASLCCIKLTAAGMTALGIFDGLNVNDVFTVGDISGVFKLKLSPIGGTVLDIVTVADPGDCPFDTRRCGEVCTTGLAAACAWAAGCQDSDGDTVPDTLNALCAFLKSRDGSIAYRDPDGNLVGAGLQWVASVAELGGGGYRYAAAAFIHTLHGDGTPLVYLAWYGHVDVEDVICSGTLEIPAWFTNTDSTPSSFSGQDVHSAVCRANGLDNGSWFRRADYIGGTVTIDFGTCPDPFCPVATDCPTPTPPDENTCAKCDACPDRLLVGVTLADATKSVTLTLCLGKFSETACAWANVQTLSTGGSVFSELTCYTDDDGRKHYRLRIMLAGPNLGNLAGTWVLDQQVGDDVDCPDADWTLVSAPPATDTPAGTINSVEGTEDDCPREAPSSSGCPTDCTSCADTIEATVSGTGTPGDFDGTGDLARDSCTGGFDRPDDCCWLGPVNFLTVSISCVDGVWHIIGDTGESGQYEWTAPNASGCPPKNGWTLIANTVDGSTPVITLDY